MKSFFAIGLLICGVSAMADPLQEFESIVARCKAAHEAQPAVRVAFSERPREWSKYLTKIEGVTYDVRKTESLVSPLAAFIEITTVTAHGHAQTEDEIKAIEVDADGPAYRSIERIRYGYRDGAWQVIDGSTIDAVRSAKGEYFRRGGSSPSSRESLIKRPTESPIRACLGTT